MKPNTNSLVLWSNARIQLIVTGLTERSKNKKTGGMIQTYIIRKDMSPLDAMRQDKDKAICGNCPLRGATKKQGKRKNRPCYVNVGQAPQALYKAVKNFGGSITKAQGKPGRLGSYGDPSFVPVPVWKRVLNLLSGHTGYTHQWARPTTQAYSAFLMASVESVDAKKQANSRSDGAPSGSCARTKPFNPMKSFAQHLKRLASAPHAKTASSAVATPSKPKTWPSTPTARTK
jgi:hypothetical protein